MSLALVGFWAVVAVSPGPAQEIDATQQGKALYEKHCAMCHGMGAAGQDKNSPAGGWDKGGALLAPALNGTGHAWHHSPALIYRYIQKGSPSASSPMPSFGDRLDDTDIRAVISYIQSLWPDEILRRYKARFETEPR